MSDSGEQHEQRPLTARRVSRRGRSLDVDLRWPDDRDVNGDVGRRSPRLSWSGQARAIRVRPRSDRDEAAPSASSSESGPSLADEVAELRREVRLLQERVDELTARLDPPDG